MTTSRPTPYAGTLPDSTPEQEPDVHGEPAPLNPFAPGEPFTPGSDPRDDPQTQPDI
ncbi:MAG: hypothetical protein ACJ72D_22115 [Marmoricola sp.]